MSNLFVLASSSSLSTEIGMKIGMETYITMVVFVLVVIYIIYYMIHTYHAGSKQYGIASLTEEEQARVREDMKNGYYCGNVIVCRDGVLLRGTKFVRYKDMVWLRLMSITYTAVAIPVGTSSRIFLYDRRGKQLDVEFGAKLKPEFQSEGLKPLDLKSFLDMICSNAPWCFIGKQGENKSFGHMKKISAERYEQIMRERQQQ